MPQDAIASLLQRLVRSFPPSAPRTNARSNLKEHLGTTESDIEFQEEIRLTEYHWDSIALAPCKGKSHRRESLNLPDENKAACFRLSHIATEPNRHALLFPYCAKPQADIEGQHVQGRAAIDQSGYLHFSITQLKSDRCVR